MKFIESVSGKRTSLTCPGCSFVWAIDTTHADDAWRHRTERDHKLWIADRLKCLSQEIEKLEQEAKLLTLHE